MAERRCFTKKITESDAFLDMPVSTQCLYFHLNMNADDDGFVNNPRKLQRMVGCTEDDLKLLIAKNFLLAFDTGVIVIKHWRMHNTLRNDRYHPTDYKEEFQKLGLKDNGSYTFNLQLATNWQPDGNQLETEHNITKDNITKSNKEKKAKAFTPPSLEEVVAYFSEKHLNGDPKKFYEYYSVANWHDSKGNPIKNWKQKALAVWDKPSAGSKYPTFSAKEEMETEDVDLDQLRRKMFDGNH